MNRYFTIMVVPERDKGVKSFRVPRVVFHSLVFLGVILCFLTGIFIYDYSKVLTQVHENKHLTIENRQLKEQIQLFQMKLNSLTEDIERIHTFERKLRVITGLESLEKLDQDLSPSLEDQTSTRSSSVRRTPQSAQEEFDVFIQRINSPYEEEEFQSLKELYEQKIATTFGLHSSYVFTREWSDRIRQSFGLARSYASFDFRYNELRQFVRDLEANVHRLDQYLLDKESLMRSTPTLMPARGWITSYYGPRHSPHTGRLRMHEGLDIGARTGTPILAPADGIITFSGKKMGFGNLIHIDHGYGIETIYAHAHTLVVEKGERIRRGEKIATVGSTGFSTGPHLHYEVRVNGTPVDPLFYILDQ